VQTKGADPAPNSAAARRSTAGFSQTYTSKGRTITCVLAGAAVAGAAALPVPDVCQGVLDLYAEC
jgi:hypothetical protein